MDTIDQQKRSLNENIWQQEGKTKLLTISLHLTEKKSERKNFQRIELQKIRLKKKRSLVISEFPWLNLVEWKIECIN